MSDVRSTRQAGSKLFADGRLSGFAVGDTVTVTEFGNFDPESGQPDPTGDTGTVVGIVFDEDTSPEFGYFVELDETAWLALDLAALFNGQEGLVEQYVWAVLESEIGRA